VATVTEPPVTVAGSMAKLLEAMVASLGEWFASKLATEIVYEVLTRTLNGPSPLAIGAGPFSGAVGLRVTVATLDWKPFGALTVYVKVSSPSKAGLSDYSQERPCKAS